MKTKNLIPYTAFVVFSLTVAFAAGYLIRSVAAGARSDFGLLEQAHRILRDHAFDPIPAASALEYGMIRGMLEAYGDPYTVFVEPARHELESNDLQGSFGGIGTQVVRDEAGRYLLYPFPDSPARQAGVIDADELVSVEDLEITAETPQDQVTAAIRGPENSRISISVLRGPDQERLTFTMRRASMSLPSVTWRIAPEDLRVGVVEVNILAASTPEEVRAAIGQLQQQGAALLVLDLRDNNGGLLTAGVETARLFLQEGDVIQQQYRDKEVETQSVERPGDFVELPLVVLINQNTASAAEIVAGALQRHGRALLIGHPSFGKDSIQLVFEMDDGSSLHVTAARWWVPGLEPPLSEGGLQPDLLVIEEDPSSGVDSVMKAAIELLTGG
jgi:carboxyl-terminal processing protease